MLRNGTVRFLSLALILMLLCPTAALGKYATLSYGSKGAEVKNMQNALITLGFLSGSADGKFGSATQTAVKNYQKSAGLKVDGKAGDQTLTLLYSAAAIGGSSSSGSSQSSSSSTLKSGDTGSAVKELQNQLKKLGYYSGTADGKYGSGTVTAVKKFQKANGLTADGKAGAKTRALLEIKSSAASSSGTSSSSSGAAVLTRTLRRGCTGEDVKAVQTRLKDLGYFSNKIDGSYGSNTITAVMKFQKNNGLTADGLTGQKTYTTLMSSGARTASNTTLQPGSSGTTSSTSRLVLWDTGAEVKEMQKALSKLGYACSTDGTYGTETQQAVCDFQRINGLTVDGIAGSKTLQLLYSGNAKKYSASASSGSGTSGGSVVSSSSGGITSNVKTPDGSNLRLMHWFNEVKGTLSSGNKLHIYDYSTGLEWTLRVLSRGRHCDSEPVTAEDTATMFKAFGNKNDWTPKAVYVKLPSGMWTLATLHNVPHESGSVKDNNFDGHMCVHFLRDMSECSQNDPNYGVTHQNAIRKAWKSLTGMTVE